MSVGLCWVDEKGSSRSCEVVDRVFVGRVCRGVAAHKSIIIADPRVSKDHAVITRSGAQVTVCDSSTNGTLLNGARLTSGVDRVLRDGDTLCVGKCTITVKIHGEDRAFETLAGAEQTATISLKPVVTHLVADVRGYSAISQRLSSSDVYDVMKEIFKDLSKVVHRRKGVVKDFAGDALFAVWEHGESAQAERAVHTCLAALEQFRTLEMTLENLPAAYRDFRRLRMGWGITTGTVTLSHFGLRKDLMAVVGDSTNLAFRLAGLANKDLESPIVLCGRTGALVGGELPLRDLGEIDTKGREGKERVFGLEISSGKPRGTSRP